MNALKLALASLAALSITACDRAPTESNSVAAQAPAAVGRVDLSAQSSKALWKIMTELGFTNTNPLLGADILKADQINCAQIVVPGFPYHCSLKDSGYNYDANQLVNDGVLSQAQLSQLNKQIHAGLAEVGAFPPPPSGPILGGQGHVVGYDVECIRGVFPGAQAKCSIKDPNQDF